MEEKKYERLAKVISFFHGLWIVILCLLLVAILVSFIWLPQWLPWVWGIQAGMMFMQVGLGFIYGQCPMTKLENSLRARANPDHVLMKSFISDRLERWFGWNVPAEMVSFGIIALLAATVIAGPIVVVLTLNL